MSRFQYVILGGGLSAGYAAQEFVEKGIAPGELCIVSAEKTLPYERPPLSKDFLAGEENKKDILINDPQFYEENGIEVMLGTRVERVDLQQKKLFSNGHSIDYEKLIIATGSRPREFDLPGSDLENIFYLRRIGDSKRIREHAQDAKNAVVIGGSFIGMETSAVLSESGVKTTMIYPEKHVWQKLFSNPMSVFFENYYRDRGVVLMPETEIVSFMGDGERVTHVETSNGIMVPADLVVAGIGVLPNTEIFQDSGLELADEGIVVNRFLETNLPDVMAIGDIARYKDVIFERPMRIEHWDNAVAQGRHAARVTMGQHEPFEHVPYFFSDEFDLSYEFWGDTSGMKQVVHRGDVQSGSFSAWWLDEDGRLLAAFVMDRPDEERELAPEWIKARKQLDADWLLKSETLKQESQ